MANKARTQKTVRESAAPKGKARAVAADAAETDNGAKKRRSVTQVLTRAAVGHFCKLRFAVHTEIGIERYGRQRADLLCMNLHGDVVIVEVKSSREDYLSDTKWHKYLDKCCRFYFCISEDLWTSKTGARIKREAREHGAGVLVLNSETGFLNTKVKASKRELDQGVLLRLSLKMNWRYGLNARTTRRTRQYL